MSETILRVEKLENGYTVEICDPAIQEANRAPSKSGKAKPWQDPWKEYGFSDAKSASDFIAKHLDKLQPEDEEAEYAGAFSSAVASDD